MKYEWNTNEVRMKYEWNTNEIWMKYEQQLNKKCIKNAKNGSILPRASGRFDGKLHAEIWKFENAKVRGAGWFFREKEVRFCVELWKKYFLILLLY